MTPQRPSFLSLCPAEPFRIFFPLATLLGISGVSLWPLFFFGTAPVLPRPDARAADDRGVPRRIRHRLSRHCAAAPALRAAAARGELWTLLALYLLTAGLHIGQQPRAGDLAFIALMLCFGACMIARVRHREELPPPGFVLVAFGYLSGLVGPVLWLCGVQGWVSRHRHDVWRDAAQSGVRALSSARHRHVSAPALSPPARRAHDGRGAHRLTRLAAARSVFVRHRTRAPRQLLARSQPPGNACRRLAARHRRPLSIWPRWFLSIANPAPCAPRRSPRNWRCLALVAGLIFPLFWPGQRVAGLHVVFLGGFSLITFTVATRVVLGHSGNEALFETRLPSLQIATLLLLAGAVLRAVGDFSSERPHWLNAASYLWMLAAGVWGFAVLPKVRIADSSGDVSLLRSAQSFRKVRDEDSPPHGRRRRGQPRLFGGVRTDGASSVRRSERLRRRGPGFFRLYRLIRRGTHRVARNAHELTSAG